MPVEIVISKICLFHMISCLDLVKSSLPEPTGFNDRSCDLSHLLKSFSVLFSWFMSETIKHPAYMICVVGELSELQKTSSTLLRSYTVVWGLSCPLGLGILGLRHSPRWPCHIGKWSAWDPKKIYAVSSNWAGKRAKSAAAFFFLDCKSHTLEKKWNTTIRRTRLERFFFSAAVFSETPVLWSNFGPGIFFRIFHIISTIVMLFNRRRGQLRRGPKNSAFGATSTDPSKTKATFFFQYQRIVRFC